MKPLLLISLFIIGTHSLFAQEMKKTPLVFNRYLLGKSGCAAAFPAELKETGVKEGSDGSTLYLSKVVSNGYTFTVAVQKLSVPMSRSRTEQSTMLQEYMKGLRAPWKIARVEGHQNNDLNDGYLSFPGISEFWRDENGIPYAVQGWANQYFYVLMSVHGKSVLPDEEIRNQFFYSFLFPEGSQRVQNGGAKKKKRK